MPRKPDRWEWEEAVFEYGEMRCQGCVDAVDLSDAETINEGIEIWNEHVRQEHPEAV